MNKKIKSLLIFTGVFIIVFIFAFFYLIWNSNEQSPSTKIEFSSPLITNSQNLIEDLSDEGLFKLKDTNSKSHENLNLKIVDEKKESLIKLSSYAIDSEKSDEIFEISGEQYIMRGEETYALGSIDFSPSLPTKICVNDKEREYIDITVRGNALIEFNYRWGCAFPGGDNYKLKVRILEADTLSGDDLIEEVSLDINHQCDSPETLYVPFSYTFQLVDLGRQFGGAEDSGTIEIYATVEPLDKKTMQHSTKDINIDKDSSCQCVRGECCDLSTHKIKSSGSQPNGKEDSYSCAGSSSVLGTNYVKLEDYYCDGESYSVKSKTSVKDNCGVCSYCRVDGDTSCSFYSSSTSCGTGKHCTGGGLCVSCKSHDNYKCDGGDVYWFDECGNKEEKKEECGTSENDIVSYCDGNNVRQYTNVVSKGCQNNKCTSVTSKKDDKLVKTCSYKCEERGNTADCVGNPNVVCSAKNHCYKTGYQGNLFCFEGNVNGYKIQDYNCINPGQSNSYCNYDTLRVLVESCQNGCENGECKKNATSSSQCKTVYSCEDYNEAQCRGDPCRIAGEDEKLIFLEGTDSIADMCYQREVSVCNWTTKGGVKGCYKVMVKDIIDDGCPEIPVFVDEEYPDLIVKDVNIQGINGKTVILSFTIENIGEGFANNIYWMVDTNSFDENPKRTNPISLSPGGSTKAFMILKYSVSGNYAPLIIVDFDNLIYESNELNNKQSISVTI